MMRSGVLVAVIVVASTLFAAATIADGSDEDAGLEVKIRLPSAEAPEGIQLPVLVTVSRDGIPLTGAIVRLSSKPSAAFVPDTGETGPSGEFRSVMLTPPVTKETLVAVVAVAGLKGVNKSVDTTILVWPEPGTEELVVDLSVEPRVLRAGEVAQVEVNVTGSRAARVASVTVVLLADPLLELSVTEGITDRNGSFRTTLRARQSDIDASAPLRAQAFKRGMSANESSLRLAVVRTVTPVAVWEEYGGWIVLVSALGVAAVVFLILHYRYVRGTPWPVASRPQSTVSTSAPPPQMVASMPGSSVAPGTRPPR